jgi:cytoskeletal protein RodZ
MNHLEYQHQTDQQTTLFEPDTLGSQIPGQKPDVENEERVSPVGNGIGALLKNERQRRGLDLDLISEITRIRPHILKALENEAWGSLPAPIIVKGFVRSYAHALGLDEGEVLALYKKVAPVASTLPKPLGEPVRSRKTLLAVLIVILVSIVSTYFWWKEYLPGKRISVSSQVIHPEEPASSPVAESVEPEAYTEKDLAPTARAVEPFPEFIDIEPPSELLEDIVVIPSYAESVSTIESEIYSDPAISQHILKANVREKTWIRIFVDEQGPKEYIFNPGSHPEWKAKEGLELLIGNASGISLEFNEEQIENLGNPGQVVHLSLPEGYKRKKSQD